MQIQAPGPRIFEAALNSSTASDPAGVPSRDGVAGCCDAGVESSWLAVLASSRFRRLSREFFWVGLGQAATVLGAVVGVRILTGLLAPDVYGQLALGMTVAMLIQQLVLGPLGNGATRFYAAAREAQALYRHIAAVKQLLRQATAGIVIATILLCFGLLLAGQSRWIGLTVVAVGYALLSGYNSVINGMQNAARQRAIVALHQGLATWGRFLLAAVLVWCLVPSSTVAMFGYAGAILLVLLSQGWFFLRVLRQDRVPPAEMGVADAQWSRQILAYAWPFATWGLLRWANLAADRWALQMFTSSYEVGLYAALFQLGFYPITMLEQLGKQLLAPIYFQRAGDATDPARLLTVYVLGRRVTLLAILLTLLMACACLVLHKPIFSLLVAKEYAPVSKLLPLMVLAAGLTGAAGASTVLVNAQRATSFLILPNNVSSILGVILTLVGAACYGISGIVVARIVFALIYLGWIMAIVKRQYMGLRNAVAEQQLL